MKDIVLITAYTPDVERTDNLRELIKKIKSFGYDVCLSTHTPTPQYIIDRCDYFIFDSKNEINTDRDITYWFTFTAVVNPPSPHFTIEYKPYKTMATHIVPIIRLVVGGLSYLKSLNAKKVYLLEYDSEILSDEIFKKMSMDLDVTPVSAFYEDSRNNKNLYCFGPILGLNLDVVNPSMITTDDSDLVSLYREYFNDKKLPSTEMVIYDYLWSNYQITWNNISDFDGSLRYDTSAGKSPYSNKNTYIFHTYKDALYFFCTNESSEVWKFDLIINDTNNVLISNPGTWVWRKLLESNDIEKLKNIKIIMDGEMVHEINIPDGNPSEVINQWVGFIPHFE